MNLKCAMGIHDWSKNCNMCVTCGKVRLSHYGYAAYPYDKCDKCGLSCFQICAFNLLDACGEEWIKHLGPKLRSALVILGEEVLISAWCDHYVAERRIENSRRIRESSQVARHIEIFAQCLPNKNERQELVNIIKNRFQLFAASFSDDLARIQFDMECKTIYMKVTSYLVTAKTTRLELSKNSPDFRLNELDKLLAEMETEEGIGDAAIIKDCVLKTGESRAHSDGDRESAIKILEQQLKDVERKIDLEREASNFSLLLDRLGIRAREYLKAGSSAKSVGELRFW